MKKVILLAGLLVALGGASAQAAIVSYDVVATFFEPATQPNNTIFTGSFDFDDATGTVSNLRGWLTESMTGMGGMGGGGGMNELYLGHQLHVSDPVLGGVLVTVFLNDSTHTFSGGDGWSPGTGGGVYSGYPGANPGNAYAMIFVNTTNPLAPLTQDQIDRLAYADCAPGGMMGAVCMTGTNSTVYGAPGTMGGYPLSQVTTLSVPEPSAALLALFGLAGLSVRARKPARSAC